METPFTVESSITLYAQWEQVMYRGETTKFTLEDGTVEEYDIVGELNKRWLYDNGFIDNYQILNFTWVKRITELDIGSHVTDITGLSLNGCSSLVRLSLGDGITVCNGSFANCTSLVTVAFGSNLRQIYTSAFEGCSALRRVVIPDNVVSIMSNAFIDSGITHLFVGQGVENIGAFAFSGCSHLTYAVIGGNVETIGQYAFSGTSYYLTMVFLGKTE